MIRRLRKMTPVNQLTEQFARSQENPVMREAVLRTLPKRLFGEAVAKQITRIEVVDSVLLLHIPDPTWRKELNRRRKTLLQKVREVYPEAVRIQIEPAEGR